MSDLPRLELALGAEFNECSIASAELAKQAHELFAESLCVEEKVLYWGDTSDRPYPVQARVMPVSHTKRLPSGREVTLSLARLDGEGEEDQAEPLKLIACVRGDIAFQVAAFSRRPGSGCDFVQLGPEINEDTLVVTTQDELSRKDMIEELRALLPDSPYPFSEKYQQLATQSFKGVFLTSRGEAIWDALVAPHISQNFSIYSFNKDTARLAAMSALAFSRRPNIKNYTKRSQKRYEEALAEVKQGFEQLSAGEILAGNIPGGNHPDAKLFLLRMALQKTDKADTLTATRKQQKAADTPIILKHFGVEQSINTKLGAYDAAVEKAVAAVGSVALSQGVHMVEIEDVQIGIHTDGQGGTRAGATLRVEVTREDVATTVVSISARPAAMEESAFVHTHHFRIDKREEQALDAEDAKELTTILGRTATGQ